MNGVRTRRAAPQWYRSEEVRRGRPLSATQIRRSSMPRSVVSVGMSLDPNGYLQDPSAGRTLAIASRMSVARRRTAGQAVLSRTTTPIRLPVRFCWCRRF